MIPSFTLAAILLAATIAYGRAMAIEYRDRKRIIAEIRSRPIEIHPEYLVYQNSVWIKKPQEGDATC